MKSRTRLNHFFRSFAKYLILFTIVGVVLYLLFGHTLIELAYNNQTNEMIEKILEGRDQHGLDHYFSRGNYFIKRISFLTLGTAVFFLLPVDLILSFFTIVVFFSFIELGFRAHDLFLSLRYPGTTDEALLWVYDEKH